MPRYLRGNARGLAGDPYGVAAAAAGDPDGEDER